MLEVAYLGFACYTTYSIRDAANWVADDDDGRIDMPWFARVSRAGTGARWAGGTRAAGCRPEAAGVPLSLSPHYALALACMSVRARARPCTFVCARLPQSRAAPSITPRWGGWVHAARTRGGRGVSSVTGGVGAAGDHPPWKLHDLRDVRTRPLLHAPHQLAQPRPLPAPNTPPARTAPNIAPTPQFATRKSQIYKQPVAVHIADSSAAKPRQPSRGFAGLSSPALSGIAGRMQSPAKTFPLHRRCG